ncbi:MAG: protein adenylyltransferase SelO family protein, partial [Verrucomicrobiota bacterium]
RIGTFQIFAARGEIDRLKQLTDYAIARHYPDANGPMGLLTAVRDAQAQLIAGWMALGFIHGVMNTDNAAISGETIDYGPCAFLDVYHPNTVFSSIDQGGRYAYANQPDIAVWNRKNAYGRTPLRIARGYRRGNFRPIVEMMEAVEGLMRKHGVEVPPRGDGRPDTSRKGYGK